MPGGFLVPGFRRQSGKSLLGAAGEECLGLGPSPGGQRLFDIQQGIGHGADVSPITRTGLRWHDSINASARASAAHREIDRSIRPDFEIGDVERRAGQKLLHGGRVGAPLALQVDRIDDSQRPVGHQEGASVFRPEAMMIVELDADGRSAPCFVERRQAVDVVVRRVGRPGAPDEVGARRAVADADVPVPRQADIPFHVAVEGEQLGLRAEGGVEVIAEAGGDQAHVLAIEVHAPDGSARSEDVGGVAVGVVEARQQHVLGRAGLALVGAHAAGRPARQRRVGRQFIGVGCFLRADARGGVVADDEVEEAIRAH